MFVRSDGGKHAGKPICFQRDGWYMKTVKTAAGNDMLDAAGNVVREKVVQKMQHSVGGVTTQKGIKTILQERGLFKNDLGHPSLLLECGTCKLPGNREESVALGIACCARAVLSREPDFLEQKEWLEETVEDELGFKIIFFPKYHCELNYIELVWGWIKAHHRRTCTYNFNDLRAGLPDTMELHIPLITVQRYYRYCFRFMSGYRSGLTGVLLAYSVKKYKGHRTIPANIRHLLGNTASTLPTDVRYVLASENVVEPAANV